jgi:hypothetical protein
MRRDKEEWDVIIHLFFLCLSERRLWPRKLGFILINELIPNSSRCLIPTPLLLQAVARSPLLSRPTPPQPALRSSPPPTSPPRWSQVRAAAAEPRGRPLLPAESRRRPLLPTESDSRRRPLLPAKSWHQSSLPPGVRAGPAYKDLLFFPPNPSMCRPLLLASSEWPGTSSSTFLTNLERSGTALRSPKSPTPLNWNTHFLLSPVGCRSLPRSFLLFIFTKLKSHSKTNFQVSVVKCSSLMCQLSDSLMENAWLPFCVVIVECTHTGTLWTCKASISVVLKLFSLQTT